MTSRDSSAPHAGAARQPDVSGARSTSAPPAAESVVDDTAAGASLGLKTATCACCGESVKTIDRASAHTQLPQQQQACPPHSAAHHKGRGGPARAFSPRTARTSAAPNAALKQRQRALARRRLGLARRTRPRMSAAEARWLLSAFVAATGVTAAAVSSRRCQNEEAVLLADVPAPWAQELAVSTEVAARVEECDVTRCGVGDAAVGGEGPLRRG